MWDRFCECIGNIMLGMEKLECGIQAQGLSTSEELNGDNRKQQLYAILCQSET